MIAGQEDVRLSGISAKKELMSPETSSTVDEAPEKSNEFSLSTPFDGKSAPNPSLGEMRRIVAFLNQNPLSLNANLSGLLASSGQELLSLLVHVCSKVHAEKPVQKWTEAREILEFFECLGLQV